MARVDVQGRSSQSAISVIREAQRMLYDCRNDSPRVEFIVGELDKIATALAPLPLLAEQMQRRYAVLFPDEADA